MTDSLAVAAMAEAVLTASPLAIIGMSEDGRVLTWNPAAERLFGWRADDVVGRVLPIVPEDRVAEAAEWWRRAFYGEVLTGLETTRRHLDGRELDVALSIAPLESDGGVVTSIVFMYLDISARLLAQAATRRTVAELRAVVEGSPVPIGVLDREFTLLQWNPAAEHLFGWRAEEVLGRFPPTIPPELVEETTASWAHAFEGHEVESVEVQRLHQDGHRLDVVVSSAPIRDERGAVTRLVFLCIDMTARKHAERQLARYCEDVEESRALAEGQAQDLARLAAELDEARNDALESVRLKSAFLATMSHEIRTPLNGVIGMTGLLLDTDLTGVQRQYAGTARSSGEALLGLINDILDFSKIEAGKLSLEVVPVAVRGAVEDVLELLADRAQAKGLELIASVAPDVPAHGLGDSGRLRQVLTNLVGNAVKFTECGAVSVRVGRVEGDVLRFEITDTGIGLTQDGRARLFQPFSQADESTTRKYGGTGLGLAICRQIVELMGGAIGVESEPGRGSTFWFTARLPAVGGAAGSDPALDLGGTRVLVVDDHAEARAVLADQLGRWGATVEMAGDAVGAFAALRAAAAAGRPYEVLVIDRGMPDPDGLALTQAVRHDAALGTPAIILLTTIEGHPPDAGSRPAGVDACVTKPIRVARLAEALAQARGLPVASAAVIGRDRKNGTGVSLRILLAEDNKVNQLVARQVLRSLGHRVDVVANGLEACEAVRTIPYDVVLMDCEMPELDGFGATRRIRGSAGPRHDVPIIAMTANAMEGDRQRCLAAGMNDYVAKPFRVSDLGEALRRWSPEPEGEQAVAPEPHGSENLSEASAAERYPVLDHDNLDALRELAGDTAAGFVRELIDSFAGELPARLDAMAVGLVRAEAPAVGSAAHALKGAAGNLGTRALQHACERLEAAGRAGDLAAAGPIFGEVRREAERAMAALRIEAGRSVSAGPRAPVLPGSGR